MIEESTEPIYTVQSLRKAGYLVSVTHYRRYKVFNPEAFRVDTIRLTRREAEELSEGYMIQLEAKGGETAVDITTPDKNKHVFGVSYCNKCDAYNKKDGIRRALERALEQLAPHELPMPYVEV